VSDWDTDWDTLFLFFQALGGLNAERERGGGGGGGGGGGFIEWREEVREGGKGEDAAA